MPKEFQKFIDSMLGHLPGMHVYLEDTPIATRGSEERNSRQIKNAIK